jgi:hypothetical protein
MRVAIISRQWSLLINCSEEEVTETWPSLTGEWKKKRVDHFMLSPAVGGGSREHLSGNGDSQISGADWTVRIAGDDRRPGRRSLLLETPQAVLGVAATSQMEDAPAGSSRVLILDASWTHVPAFPDREEIRQAFVEAFEQGPRGEQGRVYYLTNLAWDAELFSQVAADLGRSDQSRPVLIDGEGDRLLKQARQIIPEIESNDVALIGLVPGRDDRGAFQRLRSDFAERTAHVQAFPAVPISSGPGPSREESLAAVGLWLPTTVLIAGGPISEQHLLARHLEESTGGSAAVVGVSGGEYRLPGLDLIRVAGHSSVLGRQRGASGRPVGRGRVSYAGLVVVTYEAEDAVTLSGAGLAEAARQILPKIRISRRGKPPEQIVREVEAAFSSRGMAVPAVRYLP